ncbi:MAG: hypothetical protein ACYC8V_09470 [Caulobacteraceae bacterium]
MAIGTPVSLGTANNTGAVVSEAITGVTVAAGTAIIVLAGFNVVISAPSVTDSAGNVYSVSAVQNAGGSRSYFLAWSTTGGALAGGSITASWTTAGKVGMAAIGVTGLAASPLDVTGTAATGTATSAAAVATGTLASANELLIGANYLQAPGTYTPGGSFTALTAPQQSSAPNIDWAWQIVSSNGSVSWSPSWVNSCLYGSNIWTFMGATGAVPFNPAARFAYLAI